MFGGGSKCDSTSDSDSDASAFCHAQGIGDGFGEVFPGWLRRRWEKERKGHELEDITRDARKTQQFSPEQDELSPELEAELEAMQQQAEQKGDLQRRQKTEELVRQVRDLGHWPKESAARSLAERQLAEKFRRARKANQFSPDEEAELEAVQQAGREASAAACLTGASSNQAPPDQIAKDKIAKTKIAKTKNAKTKIAKAKIVKTKIAKTKIACAKAGQALGGPARP